MCNGSKTLSLTIYIDYRTAAEQFIFINYLKFVISQTKVQRYDVRVVSILYYNILRTTYNRLIAFEILHFQKLLPTAVYIIKCGSTFELNFIYNNICDSFEFTAHDFGFECL